MIDTHCHLTDPRLFDQLDAVLSRAQAAGVSRMITIATEPEDWNAVIEVCRHHSNVRCAIGVHPNNCNNVQIEQIALLRGLQVDPSVVALGEMGLDYHYDDVPRDRQATFFQAQLQLAREFQRPVVVHCREAVDDCLAILKGFAEVPAVFHCFTGTVDEARRILDAGYMIGFTGVVTYKNAPAVREVARFAPADRIFVETDAPYLSPEPMRKQKINEPALVMHTAAAVASARGISVEELDRLTSQNVERFFGWT